MGGISGLNEFLIIMPDTLPGKDEAIKELSPTNRAIFVLRHIEGLSTEETGRMLNMSASAIKSKLHRIRGALEKKLRAVLKDDARTALVGSR